jgi:hypothetical protein
MMTSHEIFERMIVQWDEQIDEDIEPAIAMLIAYWAECSDGSFAMTRVLDTASNMYHSAEMHVVFQSECIH